MAPQVFIITGAMASGKSSVAFELAKRFARGAHVEGDAFLRMFVSGRAIMGPSLDAEAKAQLMLRHELGIDAVRRFARAGFAVIYEDILIGDDLTTAIERLDDLKPRVVVLTPSIGVLAERDRGRAKVSYSDAFPPELLADALAKATPRIGLWIDTSEMGINDVVETILTNA